LNACSIVNAELDQNNLFVNQVDVITGAQLRAARALLKWSAKEAAERSGVALTTVQRLEQSDGPASGRAQTHFDLQRAFESAGVEFIGTPDDKPGVRLVKPGKPAKARTP
jgi:transcriptional regulator with XRE-family HTH domain